MDHHYCFFFRGARRRVYTNPWGEEEEDACYSPDRSPPPAMLVSSPGYSPAYSLDSGGGSSRGSPERAYTPPGYEPSAPIDDEEEGEASYSPVERYVCKRINIRGRLICTFCCNSRFGESEEEEDSSSSSPQPSTSVTAPIPVLKRPRRPSDLPASPPVDKRRSMFSPRRIEPPDTMFGVAMPTSPVPGPSRCTI